MIKTMNSKMTTDSELSTTEPKKNPKNPTTKESPRTTKQKTRTGTESQKWRPHGGLSAGRVRREDLGKGTGNKKHKWQVQNRQEEVKNSIGNGEAKEFICMTPRHELRQGDAGGRRVQARGE